MSQSILRTIAVGKRFGEKAAVHDISVDVRPAETLVLIGESGSGKTTLLRMFNRLTEPSAGEIRLHDRPVHEIDPIQLRRSIGYVPQDGGLLPHWTVHRNVALVPSLLGWDAKRIEARVDELLSLVRLDPNAFRRRYPRSLSGGERQRVAIARALAADPEVVLMDEPLGALDALTRHDLQQEVLELKRRLGKTFVLVTHDLDEAFLLGDRIVVLREGKCEQVGGASELLAKPATEYVRRLLERGRTAVSP